MESLLRKFLLSFTLGLNMISLVLLPWNMAIAAEGLALPAGDLVAPEIKSDPIQRDIAAGERVTVRATVTDNVAVKSVTIFYRDIGATSFLRTEMSSEPGVADGFTATLPEIAAPGLEYYIQATDHAGNTILHGHTFSPLTLSVSTQSPASEQNAAALSTPKLQTIDKDEGVNKWVWIGLGVLAVGAIIANDDDGGGEPPAVNPKPGTVVITGGTP